MSGDLTIMYMALHEQGYLARKKAQTPTTQQYAYKAYSITRTQHFEGCGVRSLNN